jgi:ATP-dependent DNA helicase RecG
MTSNLLRQLIASGESITMEFKLTPSAADTIGPVVCSFLNTQGGTLIIGVKENGQIVGVDSAGQKAAEIQSHLLEKISPKAAWSVNIDEVGGKALIVIDVPQGMESPYVYDSRIFIRKGSKTVAAIGEDINALIDQRHSEGNRWERMPALGFEINDLNTEEIRQTASEAKDKRLYKFDDPGDPLRILEQLGLASGAGILNSAVILFGRNPARRFPQVRIRAARFQGRDELSPFADNRTFEGNSFELIEQVEQFLRNHIAIESQRPKQGVKRTDKPVYPWTALREAMLNSIVHRDYAAFDGGISVAIYDDRIEFWNSGSLPEGITVENLKGPHPSRPHNPDIANVFFLRGFIERWGSGTRQIVVRCIESGLPEPQWSTNGGGVTLTIRLQSAEHNIRLNSRQLALLKRLKADEVLTPGDYFASVSKQVKERRARKDLLELLEAGYLHREGRGPSTTYIRTSKPAP